MKSFSVAKSRRYYDLKPIIDALVEREVKVMGEDEREEIDRTEYSNKLVDHILHLLDPSGLLKKRNKIAVGVLGERMSVKMGFKQHEKVDKIVRLLHSIAEHGRVDYQSDFESVLSQISLQNLERTMQIVSVKSTPWLKAHFDIRKTSGMNVVVDWPTIKDAGISDESPTWRGINISDVPVRKALWLMLASVEGLKEPLDYMIDEHGIVVITSYEKTLLQSRVYAYDLKQLLGLPHNAKGSSSLVHDNKKAGEQIAKIFNMLLDEKITIGQIDRREYMAGALIEADGYLITNTTPTNHRIIQGVLRVINDAANKVDDLKIHRKDYKLAMSTLKYKYDFETEKEPWNRCIGNLMDHLSIYNYFINWQAIKNAGINVEEMLVTASHKSKTGEFILNDILKQGSDPRKANLDYFVDRDGMVYISTVEDLSRRRMLRLYDVRDLLVKTQAEMNKASDGAEKKEEAAPAPQFKIEEIVKRIQDKLQQAIADENKTKYKIAQTHGLIAFHGVFNQHRLVEQTLTSIRSEGNK